MLIMCPTLRNFLRMNFSNSASSSKGILVWGKIYSISPEFRNLIRRSPDPMWLSRCNATRNINEDKRASFATLNEAKVRGEREESQVGLPQLTSPRKSTRRWLASSFPSSLALACGDLCASRKTPMLSARASGTNRTNAWFRKSPSRTRLRRKSRRGETSRTRSGWW